MGSLVFEVMLYIGWAWVFVSSLRSRSYPAVEGMHVLLYALPTTIVMEARNEFLQAGSGAYYPASILFFPGFSFPVGIVLAGSLYTWFVFVAARAFATRLAAGREGLRTPILFMVFLVLLLSSFLLESFGVTIGYWKWHSVPPNVPAVWLGKYLFYLRFSFPAAVAARLFSWHLRKHVEARTAGVSPPPPGAAERLPIGGRRSSGTKEGETR